MQYLYNNLKYALALIFSISVIVTFSQDIKKIYADPATAPGIKASKFIESIDFIPLETTKESKYDNLSQLNICKNNFVVFDNNTIYIFDKKGKFLYKFKNASKKYIIKDVQYVASKNALLIRSANKNFTISESKALQLIDRWKRKNISKYVLLQWLYLDHDFKTETIPTPSFALNNVIYFNGSFLLRNHIFNKYRKDTIQYRIVQYDSNYSQKHSYFPYLNIPDIFPYYYRYIIPVSSTLSDSTELIQLDFSNTIYTLHSDTIEEKYCFIMPMTNTIQPNYNSLSFRNNIDFEKFKEKNSNAIAFFYSITEHGKYLFFSTCSLKYSNKNFLFYQNILYSLNNLTTDSSIYNLPPNLFTNISQQDKDYIYTTASASILVQQKKNLLAQNNISRAFREYLSKLDENGNNIIIRIKLK